MTATRKIPDAAWKRRLDNVPEVPGRRKKQGFGELLGMLPLVIRVRRYMRQQKRAGLGTYMNLDDLDPGPVMGAPLGGLGGGTITRGWRGDFVRWQLTPGMYEYTSPAASQFSVYVRRPGKKGQAQVLNPGHPEDGSPLHGWKWDMDGRKATYHALYPRAWTTYDDPLPGIRLTCRQVSPFIPGNYEESSTPAGVFAWTIENTGKDTATVGLMFSFQNGTGGENDRAGGHSNYLFNEPAESGEVTGVVLKHVHRQPKPLEEGQDAEEATTFTDPLTFAIAAQAAPEVEVTYRTRFVTTSSGMDLWGDFASDGKLENVVDERPSGDRMAIGAGVCATVDVPPGETREVAFSLAWDMPLARFGEGRAYCRRYTRKYGREGEAAPAIARDALTDYPGWEQQITAWQEPILAVHPLPNWYKATLFNELYFIADGGTVWLDSEEGQDPLPEGDIGRFAYLEGHEYRMYNTYDVHFYASFALATLWPELELRIQRDYREALFTEYDEEFQAQATGKWVPRKIRGIVPHDIGSPIEDPWYRVNSYLFQDSTRWKDLNTKFVLATYRDYLLTGDEGFLKESWEAVKEALAFMLEFDLDEDGLIENEGYPDQTYDTWVADGPSAYSGGLWLAALTAAVAIAEKLGESDQAARYRDLLERGKQSYEELLWNGDYYDYDTSRSYYQNSIMAAQLTGHWYAVACGLPGIVPEEHARSAFKAIYEANVLLFEEGNYGAVNSMRPEGKVDLSNMQTQEVWAGTTFAVAAAMLQAGMTEEAWKTAWGIYNGSYNEMGYWFQTPEAWDAYGDFRSLGYMRPLAVWAMQWAWDRVKSEKT